MVNVRRPVTETRAHGGGWVWVKQCMHPSGLISQEETFVELYHPIRTLYMHAATTQYMIPYLEEQETAEVVTAIKL